MVIQIFDLFEAGLELFFIFNEAVSIFRLTGYIDGDVDQAISPFDRRRRWVMVVSASQTLGIGRYLKQPSSKAAANAHPVHPAKHNARVLCRPIHVYRQVLWSSAADIEETAALGIE
ncbi:MAG: hypothetical protein ACK4VP_06235 [Nitrospira sp.]